MLGGAGCVYCNCTHACTSQKKISPPYVYAYTLRLPSLRTTYLLLAEASKSRRQQLPLLALPLSLPSRRRINAAATGWLAP